MARVPFNLLEKYERFYLVNAREDMFVKRNRTIVNVEQLTHDLRNAYTEFSVNVCNPIVDQIAAKGGTAHCKITHECSNVDPWWLYNVRKDPTHGLCVGFNWVPAPVKPINLELGQSYYENDNRFRMLTHRCFRFESLLQIMLEKWRWEDVNRPKMPGDVLKLTINARMYFHVATYNEHGVLRWEQIVDPSGKLIEKTL